MGQQRWNGIRSWFTRRGAGLAQVVLFILLTAVATPLALGVGSDEQQGDEAAVGDPAPAAETGVPHHPQLTQELTGLRTARSRTYVAEDGQRLTKVFPVPVNYRDEKGHWRKINTDLERSDNQLAPEGLGFDIALPTQLDQGPVRISQGGDAVSFRMVAGETAGPGGEEQHSTSSDRQQNQEQGSGDAKAASDPTSAEASPDADQAQDQPDRAAGETAPQGDSPAGGESTNPEPAPTPEPSQPKPDPGASPADEVKIHAVSEGVVAKADGPVADYANVLDGVDLTYTAASDHLKESLTLHDRSAPERYRFNLRVSDGLRPRQDKSGGIELVNGDGDVAMSIAPPTITDSAGESGEASYDLEHNGETYRLTLKADRDWLDNPDRRYPVEIDPNVYPGPQQDCYLDQATTTTSYCTADRMKVGWNGTTDRRALMKFNVAGIVPKQAMLNEAYLAAYVLGSTTTTNKIFATYRMTRDWTNAASWARYDGTNAWTTAGGDFDSSKRWEESGQGTNPPGFQYFGMTGLVRAWMDGTYPNYGFMLKDRDANANNVVDYASAENTDPSKRPYLGIWWEERPGAPRQYTTVGQRLSDRMALSVNVGNGNLMLANNDLHINGTGMDLEQTRTFNNLYQPNGPNLGSGWQLSGGMGTRLEYSAGDSRIYVDPTGGRHPFDRLSDGSFQSPTAIDAKLVDEGSGQKLTFDKSKEVMHFNADGDLTKHEDRNGMAITYAYSAPHKLSTIADTQGRNPAVSLAYDAAGHVQKLTDSSGRTFQYGYDTSDRLTTYTDPAGKITTYGYNSWNLSDITDPRGKKTHIDYDTQNRVSAVKRGYNPATGTAIATTTFSYPAVSAPCNGASPDFHIGKTVVTDPRGNPTTYCVDSQLRVTKTVDPNNNANTCQFNSNSDPTQCTAPGSASTTSSYDNSTHALKTRQLPAKESFAWDYDPSGVFPHFPNQYTNAQGTVTKYEYSTNGNLTLAKNADTVPIQASLRYNGEGDTTCGADTSTKKGTIKCAKDGNGNQTTYQYDTRGNVSKVVPPLTSGPPNSSVLGNTEFTYDSLSRLATVYDGMGVTKTYTYDNLDRVKKVQWNDASASSVTYTYDDDGNLSQRVHSINGTTSYVYDDLNRRTKDTFPSTRTNDYGYDAASNLTSLTDSGGTVTYGYDPGNRLTSLTDPGNLQTTFGYDARNNRTRLTFPNGVEETRTYDTSDKMLTVGAKKTSTNTTLTNFSYVFRKPSDPTTVGRSLRYLVTDKDGNKTAYDYDTLDRLKLAKTTNSAGTVIDDRSWNYDPASNRSDQTVNGTKTVYSYNQANQLCWRLTGATTGPCTSPPAGAGVYSYDANGNETKGSGGRVSAYNVKNQLVSVTPQGAGTTNFSYLDATSFERGTIGSTVVHNNQLGVGAEDDLYWSRASDNGELISQRHTTGKWYYLKDGLGSIVAMTDSAGAVATTQQYDPFGSSTASTGANPSPWRFLSEHREVSGSNLYKIGARYYDPSLGRWSQIDLVDNAGDLRDGNRYVYAGDDPVNHVDPNGTHILSRYVDWRYRTDQDFLFSDRLKFRSKIGRIGSKVIRGSSYVTGAKAAYNCGRSLLGDDNAAGCDPIGNWLGIEDAQ